MNIWTSRRDIAVSPDGSRLSPLAALTTGLAASAAVVGLTLATAAFPSSLPEAPGSPTARQRPVAASADGALWGGPDAVARRLRIARVQGPWGGADAVARRVHVVRSDLR